MLLIWELGLSVFSRIKHEFTQEPDFFMTTGVIQNVTDQIPPPTGDHGDWGFNNATKTMTYLVSGKGADIDENNNTGPRDINFRVSVTDLNKKLDAVPSKQIFTSLIHRH